VIPLTIITPAYNEEKGIKDTLLEVLSFCRKELERFQVIVVDDASGDNTAQVAAGFKEVSVLVNPVNLGYGGSIKRALRQANFEHVLIMDADGTYPAGEIKKLLPFANDFDMVVGKREGKHYHGSLMKRFSRVVFYLLLKYVTGENIPDANSGLRIFKKDTVMKFWDDLCTGFSFTTTITIIMLSNQHLIKFVPIDYKKRIGKSKVKMLRDSARTFQILLQNISYYNPIKAFLPFSFISLLASATFTALYMTRENTLFYGISAVLCFISAMLFLSFGLICYVVVKAGKK